MKVKAEVKLDPNKVKQLHAAIEPSVQMSVMAVKTQINEDKVVPKDIGELERSAFMRKKSRSKYQLVYDTPYARRLYWHPEYNFRTDKNSNAQGLWMQAYIDGDKKFYFTKAFVKFMKMNAKGLIR